MLIDERTQIAAYVIEWDDLNKGQNQFLPTSNLAFDRSIGFSGAERIGFFSCCIPFFLEI
jgi:hypothetical protein